jgi:hypothetical protein
LEPALLQTLSRFTSRKLIPIAGTPSVREIQNKPLSCLRAKQPRVYNKRKQQNKTGLPVKAALFISFSLLCA